MDGTPPPAGARRLHLQLEAMRHLPPGTVLPQPASVLDRQLLADLLALPEEADPLRWTRDERGVAAGALTLRLLLERAREVCRSSGIRPPGWPPLPREYHAILGDLLDRTSGGDPWHDLPPDPAVAVDHARLRATLREVRHARGHPPAGPAAQEEWLQLLTIVLDLPDADDPVAWLAGEASATSVHLALTHVLDQCLPARDALWPDRPARLTLRPMARLRSSGGIRVMVTQVLFTETGGALRLNARLPVRALRRSHKVEGLVPSWRGFDRVVDDRGYHYLVWATETHGGTDLLGWKQGITLALYPAIVPEATELTFLAQPIVIEAHGHDRAADRVIPLPAREAGDVVWRLPLPRAARHSA